MRDDFKDRDHKKLSEEDLKFFVELGWLTAASVAIATVATVGL